MAHRRFVDVGACCAGDASRSGRRHAPAIRSPHSAGASPTGTASPRLRAERRNRAAANFSQDTAVSLPPDGHPRIAPAKRDPWPSSMLSHRAVIARGPRRALPPPDVGDRRVRHARGAVPRLGGVVLSRHSAVTFCVGLARSDRQGEASGRRGRSRLRRAESRDWLPASGLAMGPVGALTRGAMQPGPCHGARSEMAAQESPGPGRFLVTITKDRRGELVDTSSAHGL